MIVPHYYVGPGGYFRLPRWLYIAAIFFAAVVLISWILSYTNWFIRYEVDSHVIARRLELTEPHGMVFIEWQELLRGPNGGWKPGAAVEFDDEPLGFAFAVCSQGWTRAGGVVFPHWVLLLPPLGLFVPSLLRYLKNSKRQSSELG